MCLSEFKISGGMKQSLYNLTDVFMERFDLTYQEAVQLTEIVIGHQDVHDLMLDFIDEENILDELDELDVESAKG